MGRRMDGNMDSRGKSLPTSVLHGRHAKRGEGFTFNKNITSGRGKMIRKPEDLQLIRLVYTEDSFGST